MNKNIDWIAVGSIGAMVAGCGAAVAVGLVVVDNWTHNFGLPREFFVPIASGGAFVGGAMTSSLFGRAGRYGNYWAVLGALLATIIGAAAAGTIYWPGLGTFMGLATVGIGLIKFPPILLIWAAVMYGIHKRAISLRKDSVEVA